jgi:hypothetical protein
MSITNRSLAHLATANAGASRRHILTPPSPAGKKLRQTRSRRAKVPDDKHTIFITLRLTKNTITN